MHMLCRTNTIETGDGGNNDLQPVCALVYLFSTGSWVSNVEYPLRWVVISSSILYTVAFEISCKLPGLMSLPDGKGIEALLYVWPR
jgi:hypothetical protein